MYFIYFLTFDVKLCLFNALGQAAWWRHNYPQHHYCPPWHCPPPPLCRSLPLKARLGSLHWGRPSDRRSATVWLRLPAPRGRSSVSLHWLTASHTCVCVEGNGKAPKSHHAAYQDLNMGGGGGILTCWQMSISPLAIHEDGGVTCHRAQSPPQDFIIFNFEIYV